MTDENGKLLRDSKQKFLKDSKQRSFENALEKFRDKSLTELKKDMGRYVWMCGPVADSKLFNEMMIALKEGTIEALNLLIQKKSI